MGHQEERAQDQCGVKILKDTQVLHPDVAGGTFHSCFSHLHG
jgi:hypothetical protein